jgi:hypothetical protein
MGVLRNGPAGLRIISMKTIYSVWNLQSEKRVGPFYQFGDFRLQFAIEAAIRHASNTGERHLVCGSDSGLYFTALGRPAAAGVARG